MKKANEIRIETDAEDLKKAKIYIERRLVNRVDGSLRISRTKEGRARYYHNHKVDGKTLDTSLKRDDPLIGELAKKSYYQKLCRCIDEELTIVSLVRKSYDPGKKYRLYDELSVERKALIDPLFMSPKMRAELWETEEYKRYEGYPESLRHDTERGEKVRSKSERTIANLLYNHKDILAYRYEAELYLSKTGITVHPDFTVMNKRTGRIFYWEHVGMLDMEDYRNDYVEKMNAYTLEGMFPSDNFIMTYETNGIPENMQVEKAIIDMLLKG